ncbi:MAG: DsrE family protein [Acidobacteriota bacterium]
MADPSSVVFVFNSYGMGHTENADLKLVLAKKALTILATMEPPPRRICFYADGVKLCVRGSPVLGELHALMRLGVELLLCSTCIEALGLKDHVAVGTVGGMDQMITTMVSGSHVVTL